MQKISDLIALAEFTDTIGEQVKHRTSKFAVLGLVVKKLFFQRFFAKEDYTALDESAYRNLKKRENSTLNETALPAINKALKERDSNLGTLARLQPSLLSQAYFLAANPDQKQKLIQTADLNGLKTIKKFAESTTFEENAAQCLENN